MTLGRYIGAIAVAGAIAAAAACEFQSVPAPVHDRAFGDDHQWNAHEAFTFRRHWADDHGGYRPYARLARHDQDAYWSWRHAHPD